MPMKQTLAAVALGAAAFVATGATLPALLP